MISNQLTDLLDVVFGSAEMPTVEHLLTLAHFGDEYPSEVLAKVIQLMWLERNDIDRFNKWVTDNL